MIKNTSHINSPEYDREREFTVVLERIHSDIGTISDNVKDLKNRVNFMNEELGHQKEILFVIETDIRFIKKDISVMKGDVTDIKSRIGTHDNRLSRLEASKS